MAPGRTAAVSDATRSPYEFSPAFQPGLLLDSLRQWLCHSDARQVCDLPAANLLFHSGLRPATVRDRSDQWATFRQVRDLPRIRVAEPLQRPHRSSTEARAELPT